MKMSTTQWTGAKTEGRNGESMRSNSEFGGSGFATVFLGGLGMRKLPLWLVPDCYCPRGELPAACHGGAAMGSPLGRPPGEP